MTTVLTYTRRVVIDKGQAGQCCAGPPVLDEKA